MKKISSYLKNRNVAMVLYMIAGTLIYCISIVFILDLGEFYAGGITGISQLITRIFDKFFDIKISKSIFIALFNAPLFIIGWKEVSNRFAVLSLTSVILQVVIIYLFDLIRDSGFSPFQDLADNKLLLAILGGLLTGVGCGLCLRGGSSSGGMDIISQYVSLKKNISFVKFSLTVDLIIICTGGLVAGNISVAIYTIIRLLIHMTALDKIHTIYRFMKLSIITTEKEAIQQGLRENFTHGITIYPVIGGYLNQNRWKMEVVVSSYEIEDYRSFILKIDPKAFITVTKVEKVFGNFNRKAIS